MRTVDMIEFSSGRIAGGCGSTARVVGRARLAATALVARRASTAHPASRARCGAAAAQGIGDAGADRKDASAARRPTARDSTVGCPVRLLASLASRRCFAFVTYSRRAVRPGSRGQEAVVANDYDSHPRMLGPTDSTATRASRRERGVLYEAGTGPQNVRARTLVLWALSALGAAGCSADGDTRAP